MLHEAKDDSLLEAKEELESEDVEVGSTDDDPSSSSFDAMASPASVASPAFQSPLSHRYESQAQQESEFLASQTSGVVEREETLRAAAEANAGDIESQIESQTEAKPTIMEMDNNCAVEASHQTSELLQELQPPTETESKRKRKQKRKQLQRDSERASDSGQPAALAASESIEFQNVAAADEGFKQPSHSGQAEAVAGFENLESQHADATDDGFKQPSHSGEAQAVAGSENLESQFADAIDEGFKQPSHSGEAQAVAGSENLESQFADAIDEGFKQPSHSGEAQTLAASANVESQNAELVPVQGATNEPTPEDLVRLLQRSSTNERFSSPLQSDAAAASHSPESTTNQPVAPPPQSIEATTETCIPSPDTNIKPDSQQQPSSTAPYVALPDSSQLLTSLSNPVPVALAALASAQTAFTRSDPNPDNSVSPSGSPPLAVEDIQWQETSSDWPAPAVAELPSNDYPTVGFAKRSYGRLSTVPNPYLLIVTFLLILVPSLVFAFTVIPYLKDVMGLFATIAIAIVFGACLFSSCYFHALCALTDPGVIPCRTPLGGQPQAMLDLEVEVNGLLSQSKWCSTCNIYRPVRASHCNVCDVCVDRFDHHCPWAGNCIGLRNRRLFFIFIVTTTLLAAVVLGSTLSLLRHGIEEDGSYWLNTFVLTISIHPLWSLLTGYSLACLGPLLMFSLFHSYLICVNKTAREWEKRLYPEANPFDRGLQQNIQEWMFAPIPPSRLLGVSNEPGNMGALREPLLAA